MSFYRFHMPCEGTAVPIVRPSIELIFGLLALKNGPEAWVGSVDFLQNLVTVIVNLITLVTALLHTKTWFELAPKAANIAVEDEEMGPEPVTKSFWTVTAVTTIVILLVALYWQGV